MTDMVGQTQTIPTAVSPGACGVNIQIFNPAAYAPGAGVPANNNNYTTNYSTIPSYPPNYYTQNLAQPPVATATATATANGGAQQAEEKKKTEKREIVQLTDDYIRNLETYLNNQNTQVRLMGAKDVLARLQEDKTRKNDPALNALINKMLQDPYQPVKFIAMAALESGDAAGNDTTLGLLQNIQKQKTAYGEDSLKASNILLKMSAQKTEKEFEVKDKPSKTEKETKKGEK